MLFSFFILLFTTPLLAQNSLLDSTLRVAKQLRNQKKLKEAVAVLGNFEKKYPGNLWIEQMYAQTLYWMHDYRQADIIFLRALHYYPENAEVKYDYALFLVDLKHFDRARQLLETYTKTVHNNANAEALLGKLDYWKPDYKKAIIHLKKAITLNPGGEESRTLYREVLRIISPQLTLNGNYLWDTQPLHAVGMNVGFQWYKNPFADLQFSAESRYYYQISNPLAVSGFLIGDRFHFDKIKMQLTLLGGAYFSTAYDASKWRGKISLQQKLSKHFWYQLSAGRKRYDNTILSLNQPLMVNQYDFGLNYEKENGWSGKLGVRAQFFPDSNNVNAYYLWFLSKPVKFVGFQLSLGYAFNYMNAKESRFVPTESLNQIIEAYDSTTAISGIYDAYFTPLHQLSHSVLANLSYAFSKHSKLSLHASVAAYAKTDAPGFYLDKDNEQNTEIVSSTYRVSYHPLDIGASFQTDISDKLTLNLSYTYLKTYYYNTNRIHVGLKFYF